MGRTAAAAADIGPLPASGPFATAVQRRSRSFHLGASNIHFWDGPTSPQIGHQGDAARSTGRADSVKTPAGRGGQRDRRAWGLAFPRSLRKLPAEVAEIPTTSHPRQGRCGDCEMEGPSLARHDGQDEVRHRRRTRMTANRSEPR